MKSSLILSLAVFSVSSLYTVQAIAEETTSEKIQDTAKDAKRAVKKSYNKAKNEACKMVNGKMECAKDAVVDKAGEAKDAVKDKVEELKNKAD